MHQLMEAMYHHVSVPLMASAARAQDLPQQPKEVCHCWHPPGRDLGAHF